MPADAPNAPTLSPADIEACAKATCASRNEFLGGPVFAPSEIDEKYASAVLMCAISRGWASPVDAEITRLETSNLYARLAKTEAERDEFKEASRLKAGWLLEARARVAALEGAIKWLISDDCEAAWGHARRVLSQGTDDQQKEAGGGGDGT